MATALEALDAGHGRSTAASPFTVREAIPRGHKVAMRAIPAGGAVIKYGSPIGVATADIPAGRPRAHAQRVERARPRRSDRARTGGRRDGALAEPPDDRGNP